MGQQMDQYEQQFNEMRERLEQMEAKLQEQINQTSELFQATIGTSSFGK